ncbi:alpha/beta hydrolase fold [Amycolatopsis lurida]|uniref:Peptidase n=1 Tax=Amycolatopsis lurida NRRL 2430 TaxID=1460371 RepID=A0A2P2FU34_AMYLU|nr:alpha/beta hydrolase [Amycolatopsis lurida]KFU80240.1 peptidase [Amycolatopsis lurida NRRL 2430]SEE53426.1 alpha/beta hydrolase fold [Amycolatopsis lurida]
MYKRLRLAVVIPAVAGGLLAGMTPALANPGTVNTTGIPARYTEQDLAWRQCTAEDVPDKPETAKILECATFASPRNWDRPDDRQDVTIAISRLKSTGETTASVLTNPGGPGGPGRSFPASLSKQAKLRVHQEIIGIDTRGTGRSTNISCGGAGQGENRDPRDRDPRNLDLLLDTVELFTKTCEQTSGELGRFVDTFHNTKDLDLLRVLLGREKINWIGYSAGTWLGAHYAQRFPDRVGRFVLDSSVDFTSTWAASFDLQPMGYERRWRQDFLPWAATHDDRYGLGVTGEQVRQTFEAVRYALTRNPVEVDGVKVGPVDLDSRFAGLLKSKKAFPALADFLVQLKTLTGNDAPEQAKAQARAAIAAAPAEPDPLDALLAVLTAVRCNDSPTPGDRESVIRRSQEFLDQGKLLNGGGWMFIQNCIFWENQPRPLPTVNGKGVPPVVMVQSANDPATPIEGARKAHAGFENSRLLTVTGEGDHGIYGYGNPAVDEVVDAYLVDGVVPENRSVPGMPLPNPA